MLARSLVLFALALCACGTTSSNNQPPVPVPEETSDPALNAEFEKTLKASEKLNKSLEEDEQKLEEAEHEIEEAKRQYDEAKRKLTNPDQPAPADPQTEDPPQAPQIKTVMLTGKPLEKHLYDLTRSVDLDAFIGLVRQRSDRSPTVTALDGIAAYTHSVCWSSVGSGMIFRDCFLYRIEGSTAIVLHLPGGLDTVVGYFTGLAGEFTYSCENDGAVRGRNCYLVNLTTGATSKNKMFLYSHPKVLVSPAGVVYLNDTVYQGGSSFYDRIYTPDGTDVASSDGPGDFTFVAEAVVEKPVFEELRWTPGVSMAYQPRRVKAEQIDLTSGHKKRIYEE